MHAGDGRAEAARRFDAETRFLALYSCVCGDVAFDRDLGQFTITRRSHQAHRPAGGIRRNMIAKQISRSIEHASNKTIGAAFLDSAVYEAAVGNRAGAGRRLGLAWIDATRTVSRSRLERCARISALLRSTEPGAGPNAADIAFAMLTDAARDEPRIDVSRALETAALADLEPDLRSAIRLPDVAKRLRDDPFLAVMHKRFGYERGGALLDLRRIGQLVVDESARRAKQGCPEEAAMLTHALGEYLHARGELLLAQEAYHHASKQWKRTGHRSPEVACVARMQAIRKTLEAERSRVRGHGR